MDGFCPECNTNIGEGTYEAIGCPVCGSCPPEVTDSVAADDMSEEEE